MDNEMKPKIYDRKEDLPAGCKIIEHFEDSIEELFFIRNAHLKKANPAAAEPLKEFMQNHGVSGIWVFYPWMNVAVYTLPEELYFQLRTSRNKDIISQEEQNKYRNITVGVAGLSVGSAIVSAMTISGGPKKIKIADFDTVEVTNLNRIKAKLTDLGENKAHVCAREVWLLDPFADIAVYDKGMTKDNLEEFLLQPRLDVFIDEVDSLDLKIMSRFICRANKIPVLMATDNGDSVIVDVERFDLEPDREIFHGLIGDMKPEDLVNLDFKMWLKLATKIVGPEYLTERMQESLMDIGKIIPSVPQLGTTANTAGTSMSFILRRLANNLDMPSGRYTLGMEDKLIPNYNSVENIAARKEKTDKFLEAFRNKK